MQKIIHTGHSLAVTVPSTFAKALGIKRGEAVRVERRLDRGTLTFYFKGAQQLPISEKIFRSAAKTRGRGR